MIFTIGHKKSYDAGLQNNGDKFKKLGQQADYLGGSVWKTKKEVVSYLQNNQPRLAKYDVYGVLADFEKDTIQIPTEPFRKLLKTSQIVSAK